MKDLVRNKIAPQLRKGLSQLGPALIAEHGKDLQHATGSGSSSGVATPTQAPPPSKTPQNSNNPPQPGSTTIASKDRKQLVNVVTVTDTAEFRTTAAELYQTFTDPQRIAAFTRSQPTLFEGAKKGGKFELFGGNVSGEYVDLQEPTMIVQRWRLKQWPEGHFSNLEIKFDQNDQDAVTVMRVKLDGVPAGQEEVTQRNWANYYVMSIKTTFG